MRYENIIKAKFKSRPNRFIALVEINGAEYKAHVKNTGRLRELLTENADIWVQLHNDKSRKTFCSLIAVEKDGRIFNIDSQVPNTVYAEYLSAQNIQFKREVKYKNSRFDFKEGEGYTEVKGVTLDIEGAALFPDAPTERGVKHLTELTEIARSGKKAKVVFILCYKGAKYFTPNKEKDPKFAEALREAFKAGVEIKAYECKVDADYIEISKEIEVFC